MKTLNHGMLLRSKNVMDDALCELARIKELIPEKLHRDFDKIIERFEDTLCAADVADQYIEKDEHDALMREQERQYEKALADYRG